VDAASGATSWKQRARETIDGRERDASLSELAVYEGVIYAATSTGIQGWETAGGKPVFAFPATRQQGGSQPRVAIAKGVLYFQGNSELPLAEGRGAGWLYALDLKSRQLLWKYHAARPHTYDKTGSWPTLHILPADGALFYETEKRLVKLVP
jgi:outer membrane protein assembly factor BamB